MKMTPKRIWLTTEVEPFAAFPRLGGSITRRFTLGNNLAAKKFSGAPAAVAALALTPPRADLK
jgi:hypothetical protein